MRVTAAPLLLLLLTLPASAAIISPRPDKVTLVVYSGGRISAESLGRMTPQQRRDQGLALVSETRTVDLPAGISDIQFRNVAGTLVPPSVQVSGLDGISERNFDFNLLTPGTLMAKSVGQTVHLRRINPKTGAATEEPAQMRSGPDGVILQTARGVEALDCSGLHENIIFDRLPDNLLDTPTLSVRADVAKAGRYTVTVRYLATGLSWSADYVAHVAPGGATLDLTGWLTLSNGSETGFADAPVDVVAGVINQTGEDRAVLPRLMGRSSQCWPTDIDWSSVMAGYETITVSAGRLDLQGFSQPTPVMAMAMGGVPAPPPPPPVVRDLGDLKLYALGEPTTVAAQQTKQIRFLDSRQLPFQRHYRVNFGLYQGAQSDVELPSQLVLRLDNAKGGKLGKPLPAGQVAITETIGGGPVLAGRPLVDDTPVGVPLELKGNRSLAVSARVRDVVSTRTTPQGETVREMAITITNRKAVAASFEWVLSPLTGARVTAESAVHTMRDGEILWSIPLKPRSQTRLHYAVTWRR